MEMTKSQTLYQQALNGLADSAQTEFLHFWNKLDLSKPWECKQALCEFVPIFIQKYEQTASTLAVNYFENAVKDNYGEIIEGKIIKTTDEIELQKSVSYFCRQLFEE